MSAEEGKRAVREPGAGSSGSASRLTPETGHAQGLDTAAPDIWQFSYDRWKHKFPRRVIQSAVVPLPSDFVAFLLQDGVNIPGDVYNHFEGPVPGGFFPSTLQAIHDAIQSLGGTAFPKLNWSAPKDAAWVSHDRSLRCTIVRDVLLLLKSSRIVESNLVTLPGLANAAVGPEAAAAAAAGPGADTPVSVPTSASTPPSPPTPPSSPFVLVLKKWSNLYASRELRVFAAHGRVVAVTQRGTDFHPDLQNASSRLDLRRAVADFHLDYVVPAFPEGQSLVYDVYVDTKGKVWVVDIAPFHPRFAAFVDGVLFDWQEHLLPHLLAPSPSPSASSSTSAGAVAGAGAGAAAAGQRAGPRGHWVESTPLSPADRRRANTTSGASASSSSSSSSSSATSSATSSSLERELGVKLEALTSSAPDALPAAAVAPMPAGAGSAVVGPLPPAPTSASAGGAGAAERESKRVSGEDDAKAGRQAVGRAGAGGEGEEDGVAGEGEDEDDDDDEDAYAFAFRVVTEELEQAGHREATVAGIMARMPADGVDLSDGAAIERFIAMQQQALAAQGSDSDSDSEEGDEGEG